MEKLVIYTTASCPFCIRAKRLLDYKKISYQEISVDNDAHMREKMERLSGRHTVPQVFINNNPIGGCDELYALEQSGELDTLLNQ